MKLLLKASKVVEGSPEEIVLESGHVLIGQLPVNHLRLPGDDVDPIHAMVEITQDGVNLFDMGSRSGIKLNGELVEVAEKIQVGDVIQIGDNQIYVMNFESVPNPDTIPLESPPQPLIDIPTPPKSHLKSSDAQHKKREFIELELEDVKKQPPQPKKDNKPDTPIEGQQEDLVETPRSYEEGPSKYDRARQAQIAPKRVVARDNTPGLFLPGKEKLGGSVLEVVAFWGPFILDVRHYGGDVKGKNDSQTVILGDQSKGHLIGVTSSGQALPDVPFAVTQKGRVTVNLQPHMEARIKRGQNFEKITTPQSFSFQSREFALIKSGPINYFLINVTLPPSNFPRYPSDESRGLLMLFLGAYLGLAGYFWYASKSFKPREKESDVWSTVLAFEELVKKEKPKELPTPKPPVKIEPPKEVEKKQEPPKPLKQLVKPAEVKAVPVEKPIEKPVEKPVPSLTKPTQPPSPEKPEQAGTPKAEKEANDKSLSRKLDKPLPGNGGGQSGGTKSSFAGARQGSSRTDSMGVQGGKPDIPSGINLEKLGVGIGKVSDIQGVSAVKVGAQSAAGGAGAGSGSSSSPSYGFGGLGSQSSLSTGGPAAALSGLGGGAGGLGGSGGAGGRGGTGSGTGKLNVTRINVPPGDPVLEGNALSRQEIEAVIRANLGQIKACYERSLQGNPSLAGRVLTNFVIGGDGRVSSASVASTSLNHGPTESCIISAIRRWKFPLPAGGASVQVSYPFVLQSN